MEETSLTCNNLLMIQSNSMFEGATGSYALRALCWYLARVVVMGRKGPLGWGVTMAQVLVAHVSERRRLRSTYQ